MSHLFVISFEAFAAAVIIMSTLGSALSLVLWATGS